MLSELSKNILGRSFCPLGDAAAMPTISIVQKWRNEFEEHLQGRCAYKSAEVLVGSR
jgi:NADH-quinone oxidoreductase subunit F